MPAGNTIFVCVDFGKMGDKSFVVKFEMQQGGGRTLISCDPVRTAHFILKSVWFEQIKDGTKNIEYRPVTHRWSAILSKEPNVAIFSRGYTRLGRVVRVIEKIDIGRCPIPHWSGEYYRIHLAPKETAFIG